MIKSKITARAKSLEYAIDYYRNWPSATLADIDQAAKKFYDYLIGDLDLPNVEPTVEDVANNAIERVLLSCVKNDDKPKAEFIPEAYTPMKLYAPIGCRILTSVHVDTIKNILLASGYMPFDMGAIVNVEHYRKDMGFHSIVVSFVEYREGYGMHAALAIERDNGTLFTVQFPEMNGDLERIEHAAYMFAKCYDECNLDSVVNSNPEVK